MFACKKCEALKAEVEYLRGLVDRLMAKDWPKPSEEKPVEPAMEDTHERITFGDG